MKRQAKRKPVLTKKEIELLERLLCCLTILVAILSTSPAGIARDLRRRLAKKRDKEVDRFPKALIPPYHYSYGPKLFLDFEQLVKRFIASQRLGNDYDKRRFQTLAVYAKSLLKNARYEEALHGN